MGRVVAVFPFEMPGLGLWTDALALGAVAVREYEGREVRLTLPTSRSDFGLDEERGESALGTSGGRSGSSSEEAWEAATVAVIGVEVFDTAPFGAGDFKDRDKAPLDEASRYLEGLRATAERFVTAFVDHARVELGQYWLGTSADTPRLTGLTRLLDLETGERIPIGPTIYTTAHRRPAESRVTAEWMERLATGAVDSADLPLPEVLINEARYLAWVREPPDLRLAVLLAAIACESAVKRKLQNNADPVASDLLDLVLKNPRDVSIAMITHLDKTALAVLGRSLKADNPGLWKGAIGLFESRNAIAHGKSAQPSTDEMKQAVRDAVAVFSWIES